MFRLLAVATALSLAGCNTRQEHHHNGGTQSQDGHEHGGHAGHGMTTLDVMVDGGTDPMAGSPALLRLTIPGADGKPIKNYAVSHDAKVHLIVIREGLDRFAHVHPDVDSDAGELSIRHTFPVGGTYHLFADYQPVGGRPGTAVGTIRVGGESPPAPALRPDTPGTLSTDGITAKVSIDGAVPGREGQMRFELIDSAGKPAIGLEPYMGAMGHLVVVSADARRYIHAHPADDKAAAKQVVTFVAEFPEPGLYKGWGQFMQSGTVRVVPFVVQVQ